MSVPDEADELFNQSRSSGRRTSEGIEIRFIGQPILALNPATNDLFPAIPYQNHPLLADRYYYTLPIQLLQSLISELDSSAFDPELLAMEQTLSHVCGDHALSVGIWHGQLVSFQGLCPSPAISISDEDAAFMGMDPAVVSNSMRIYAERDIEPLMRFHQGYIGWLMTNPLFLDEHDVLLKEHADQVRRWGTRWAGLMLAPELTMEHLPPQNDPAWIAFNTASKAFCIRWRLLGLDGPFLPRPLEALMAGSFPLSIIHQLMSVSGVFFLPDTMPIPSRDQLRGMLDDALHRGEQSNHLEEWMQMVRSSNSARNQLVRFGRLFEIQHLMRILFQRHRTACSGNLGRIEMALASYFKLSESSIHADMLLLRQRLGDNWQERTWPI